MRSIALLETSSIARGVKALDEMVKRAPVTVLQARPICPGRYIVLIEGEVAAVEESIETGRGVAGELIVDSLFLARPHEALPSVLNERSKPQVFAPVGLIETRAVASALLAADAACKAAPVDLAVVRLAVGMAGKSFVVFCGALPDVQAAVEAGAAIAREHNRLVETTILANPDPAIEAFLV
ncbi:MAG: BMC domain-containing protein [Planctomycetes bacterium]|nr:BMC domain-containing protein [Planctomycetota bacterium]